MTKTMTTGTPSGTKKKAPKPRRGRKPTGLLLFADGQALLQTAQLVVLSSPSAPAVAQTFLSTSRVRARL